MKEVTPKPAKDASGTLLTTLSLRSRLGADMYTFGLGVAGTFKFRDRRTGTTLDAKLDTTLSCWDGECRSRRLLEVQDSGRRVYLLLFPQYATDLGKVVRVGPDQVIWGPELPIRFSPSLEAKMVKGPL